MSDIATDPIVRLLSLRVRVLRAEVQSRLLQPELPTFSEDLGEIEQLLKRAWLKVSEIVDLVSPPGANDTDEDIEAEQQRILAELREMQQRPAMQGLDG